MTYLSMSHTEKCVIESIRYIIYIRSNMKDNPGKNYFIISQI